MTDRELMQMSLDALERLHSTGDTQVFDMYDAPVLIPALRARLAEPPKDLELPLVKPEEFVRLIEGKENFRGIPVIRTEWPTREEQ